MGPHVRRERQQVSLSRRRFLLAGAAAAGSAAALSAACAPPAPATPSTLTAPAGAPTVLPPAAPTAVPTIAPTRSPADCKPSCKSPYVFRTSATSWQLSAPLGEWASKKGLKEFFVCHVDDTFGAESAEAFIASLANNGAKATERGAFPSGG